MYLGFESLPIGETDLEDGANCGEVSLLWKIKDTLFLRWGSHQGGRGHLIQPLGCNFTLNEDKNGRCTICLSL
jgi:hypothetical protein